MIALIPIALAIMVVAFLLGETHEELKNTMERKLS